MSEKYKINDELSICVIESVYDMLMADRSFFDNLYRNVFCDRSNNKVAGIVNLDSPREVETQIKKWLEDSSQIMFFLYKDKDIVGTTQTFSTRIFNSNTLALGYIVGPEYQGLGYGTIMLKFVSEYLTNMGSGDSIYNSVGSPVRKIAPVINSNKKIEVVLGFRDGNTASEKIASKNNYHYLLRTEQPDADDNMRPMTYYKYSGNPPLNESYSVIPRSKILTTNQWLEDKERIISRINPKMLDVDEYVYLSTSANKPSFLDESYYICSSTHYNVTERIKKEGFKANRLAITDKTANKMFNPTLHGDISLNEFYNLIESDLMILEHNKNSMVLGNMLGEVKIRKVQDVLIVEEYLITK